MLQILFAVLLRVGEFLKTLYLLNSGSPHEKRDFRSPTLRSSVQIL